MAYYVFDYTDVYVSGRGYIRLRYIKTSPKNIKLTAISGTVPSTGKLGVNAGFFSDSLQDVYSICIQNSSTVLQGKPASYHKGYDNVTSQGVTARGTLVWDAPFSTYRQQVISSAAQLTIGDPDNYWAQGGVSMFLKNDTSWTNMVNSPNSGQVLNDQFPGTLYNRTALLYGNSLNIYLVITETQCTLSEFRTACKSLDSSNGLDGVILDGANATQMNVPGSYSFIGGNNRTLPAMIEVVNNVQL